MTTGGRVNAAGSLGAEAPTATQTQLSSNRSKIRFGASIALSGRLVTSSGSGVAGKEVVLERRRAGSRRFARIGETTTASDGRYILQGVKPRENADYRARFISVGEFEGSRSTLRSVKVRPRLSLKTSTRRLKLNRARTIRGSILPNHRGIVKVKIKRNGRNISTRKVRLSRSRYSFNYRPKRPGTYSFKAIYPGHNDHLRAASKTKKFKVRR